MALIIKSTDVNQRTLLSFTIGTGYGYSQTNSFVYRVKDDEKIGFTRVKFDVSKTISVGTFSVTKAEFLDEKKAVISNFTYENKTFISIPQDVYYIRMEVYGYNSSSTLTTISASIIEYEYDNSQILYLNADVRPYYAFTSSNTNSEITERTIAVPASTSQANDFCVWYTAPPNAKIYAGYASYNVSASQNVKLTNAKLQFFNDDNIQVGDDITIKSPTTSTQDVTITRPANATRYKFTGTAISTTTTATTMTYKFNISTIGTNIYWTLYSFIASYSAKCTPKLTLADKTIIHNPTYYVSELDDDDNIKSWVQITDYDFKAGKEYKLYAQRDTASSADKISNFALIKNPNTNTVENFNTIREVIAKTLIPTSIITSTNRKIAINDNKTFNTIREIKTREIINTSITAPVERKVSKNISLLSNTNRNKVADQKVILNVYRKIYINNILKCNLKRKIIVRTNKDFLSKRKIVLSKIDKTNILRSVNINSKSYSNTLRREAIDATITFNASRKIIKVNSIEKSIFRSVILNVESKFNTKVIKVLTYMSKVNIRRNTIKNILINWGVERKLLIDEIVTSKIIRTINLNLIIFSSSLIRNISQSSEINIYTKREIVKSVFIKANVIRQIKKYIINNYKTSRKKSSNIITRYNTDRFSSKLIYVSNKKVYLFYAYSTSGTTSSNTIQRDFTISTLLSQLSLSNVILKSIYLTSENSESSSYGGIGSVYTYYKDGSHIAGSSKLVNAQKVGVNAWAKSIKTFNANLGQYQYKTTSTSVYIEEYSYFLESKGVKTVETFATNRNVISVKTINVSINFKMTRDVIIKNKISKDAIRVVNNSNHINFNTSKINVLNDVLKTNFYRKSIKIDKITISFNRKTIINKSLKLSTLRCSSLNADINIATNREIILIDIIKAKLERSKIKNNLINGATQRKIIDYYSIKFNTIRDIVNERYINIKINTQRKVIKKCILNIKTKRLAIINVFDKFNTSRVNTMPVVLNARIERSVVILDGINIKTNREKIKSTKYNFKTSRIILDDASRVIVKYKTSRKINISNKVILSTNRKTKNKNITRFNTERKIIFIITNATVKHFNVNLLDNNIIINSRLEKNVVIINSRLEENVININAKLIE